MAKAAVNASKIRAELMGKTRAATPGKAATKADAAAAWRKVFGSKRKVASPNDAAAPEGQRFSLSRTKTADLWRRAMKAKR